MSAQISIADVNFPLPIEVLYSEEHGAVLGARLMISPDEGVDLGALLSEDDWAHIKAQMVTLAYLPDEPEAEIDPAYGEYDPDRGGVLLTKEGDEDE